MRSMILLSAVLLATAAQATDVICPDQASTTGIYKNLSYGFSVRVPSPLKGTWNSARCSYDEATRGCVCMSDHGRDVALPGDGTISIFAAFNTEDQNLLTAMFSDLASFREGQASATISLNSLRSVRLGNLPAYSYMATLEEHNQVMVREAVIAQTASGDVNYVLYLQGSQSSYNKYRRYFLSVLSSWKSGASQRRRLIHHSTGSAQKAAQAG